MARRRREVEPGPSFGVLSRDTVRAREELFNEQCLIDPLERINIQQQARDYQNQVQSLRWDHSAFGEMVGGGGALGEMLVNPYPQQLTPENIEHMTQTFTSTYGNTSTPAIPEQPRRRGRLVAVYSVADLDWALFWAEQMGMPIDLEHTREVLAVWGRGESPWIGGFVVRREDGKVCRISCVVNNWENQDYNLTVQEGQHILDLDIPADLNLKEDPEELNRWLHSPHRESIAYSPD